MSAEVEYDKMNWLYNALYGDMTTEQIKNLYFIKDHIELLEKYPAEKSSVIDTACGNGVQATALAINGYKVTATDISEEMIKLTNEFSKNHNVNLHTQRKEWIELPKVYNKEFDIVFCTGNSLVHSPENKSRKANLKALSEILNCNGTLVIENRNWDKIIKENKRFTVYDKISYKGIDYIPLYHWILNGMEQKAKVEILFQEINKNGSVSLYNSELTFTPFTHESLINMMKDINLEITKDTYSIDNDWYYLYAKKIK